jgi:hypothetical protein
LLKLPTGALTAVAGLVLVRSVMFGQVAAAWGAPQIVACALIFGASQQAFTRLIDRQAQNVLDSIPTEGADRAAIAPAEYRQKTQRKELGIASNEVEQLALRVADYTTAPISRQLAQNLELVRDTVRATIDEAMAAPELANFTGFLEIAPAANASELPVGPGGQIQAVPGATIEIEVTVHHASDSDTVSAQHPADGQIFSRIEPVLIEDGVEQAQVSFDVIVDSLALGVGPRRQTVTVARPVGSASASFRLQVPDEPGEYSASLQLYQSGELIQVVPIAVGASHEPS